MEQIQNVRYGEQAREMQNDDIYEYVYDKIGHRSNEIMTKYDAFYWKSPKSDSLKRIGTYTKIDVHCNQWEFNHK